MGFEDEEEGGDQDDEGDLVRTSSTSRVNFCKLNDSEKH